ncbi:MAG: hypothetical protein KAT62_01680, partial [Desulfuromonadales bacterium]|nr:hypothetical protein [Desulfuromonadales bacterium]
KLAGLVLRFPRRADGILSCRSFRGLHRTVYRASDTTKHGWGLVRVRPETTLFRDLGVDQPYSLVRRTGYGST